MKKNVLISAGVSILAGSFLLVSNAAASDDYDVKAFGPKSQIVWEKPTKVVFDHKTHTKQLGLACASCHDELFSMQRGIAQKTGKLSMASLAEGKFCGGCHDGKTAFASDTNCTACHMVPEDPIVWTQPVKAVVFYHKAHTEQYGLDCDSCHNDTFAMKTGTAEKSHDFTMKALYKGRYCGACHDGQTAFASNTLCNTCHIGAKGYDRLMGIDPHAEGGAVGHSGH
jgi:c(7)-type cytochrome triheme protein